MTRVEAALRHIEKLQKRLIKAVPPKSRKPAKRRTAPKKRVDQGAKLAKQLTRLAKMPAESFTRAGDEHGAYPVKPTLPSWAAAWERANPSVTPPQASNVAPAPAQARTRGSCKAIDADTGRQCRRLEHADEVHRSERGDFTRVLPPGGVPLLRTRLDAVAVAQGAPMLDVSPGGNDTPSKREARARYADKMRNKAHAGLKTTEAHRPEDSKYHVEAGP